MLRIALWEPEIPPNTGNIARLCAATGTELHLIGRLGFRLDDHSLRRAGLDYWDAVTLHRHEHFREFENVASSIYCFSAHAKRAYTKVHFAPGDALVFGSESRGLPAEIHDRYEDRLLTIPMLTSHVRSLNLATAVGIVLYEALRQIHQW